MKREPLGPSDAIYFGAAVAMLLVLALIIAGFFIGPVQGGASMGPVGQPY